MVREVDRREWVANPGRGVSLHTRMAGRDPAGRWVVGGYTHTDTRGVGGAALGCRVAPPVRPVAKRPPFRGVLWQECDVRQFCGPGHLGVVTTHTLYCDASY